MAYFIDSLNRTYTLPDRLFLPLLNCTKIYMTLSQRGFIAIALSVVSIVFFALYVGNQRLAFAATDSSSGLPTQCSDGIDNDGDGLIDFIPVVGDPGCSSIFDNSETDTPPPPADICPNLDGIQSSVPDGYEVKDGQCVPIAPVDVCPNIDGNQSVVPDGFEVKDGQCVPVKPVDVCPNIDGTQASVPAGFHLADGQCVPDESQTDMCPNIDGIQATIPDGKVLQDGQCVDTTQGGGNGDGSGNTGDESGSGRNSSSGSSGSGSASNGPIAGSLVGSVGGIVGEILGAASSSGAISCDQYLTAFIKPGGDNDPAQVLRLQKILVEAEGAEVQQNGIYDDSTRNAVNAFQSKYADEILSPWGISKPTGFVYLTTRKKINELYCKSMDTFPLSQAELNIIAAEHNPSAPSEHAPALTSTPDVHLISVPDTKASTIIAPTDDTVTQTAAVDNAPTESSIQKAFRPVSNFFKRLFNRSR